MPAFRIASGQLELLFERDDEGRLAFNTATSAQPATLADLNRGVLFADYLMEGFVRYEIRVEHHDDHDRMLATMAGEFGSRGRHLRPHVRWHLNAVGIGVIDEED